MAIRIGLPPTIFPRLRLGWHTTRQQLKRQAQALSQSTLRLTEVPRAWWHHLSQRLTPHWSLRARALVRQRTLLEKFEAQYEELVDILCWAAKDGDHTGRDARYAAIRTWMCANYRHLRSRLRPHWVEPDGPAVYDPFEALFAPENIDEVLHATTSIEDMMVTRAALDAYRQTLADPVPTR
ncbi:MAG TPA: hypothetical protein VKU00_29990 [Chthonomonadaceae bacterium]|nr:hypothetical protein [Chthonomonadaceae bacterium]